MRRALRTLATVALAATVLGQFSGLAEFALRHLPQPVRSLAQGINFKPQPVKAAGRYTPSGGVLRAGNNLAITSAATSGNVGSWKGVLNPDLWGWAVSSTAAAGANPPGMNQIVYIDDVELNNANKIVVSLNASASSASLGRYYQICDWTSPQKVDAIADADCSGGGWRTLHKFGGGQKGRQAIAEAAVRTFVWHIYDGYWNGNGITDGINGQDTGLSTPLSNFVSSTGRVMIRASSSSAVAATHIIDWLSLDLVVDPVYFPTGSQVISGTQTGESKYILAQSPPTLLSAQSGTTGSDNFYLKVSGTAGSIADYYVRFSDVRTYTGANAIAVVAEYGCSTTGINHRPKVYNFFSSAWEDLTTTSIACSATDAVGQFGFTTSSLWKYIRNGEVRVGWYGLANGTQEIRLDYIYIIIGSTVSDPSKCEISYGTGVATQCDRMNDLDSTLASTTGWMVGSELDSNTFGHDFYPSDNDGDAVANEANIATHATFPVRLPSNGTIAALAYSVRAVPGSATVSLVPQFKDWNGNNTTAVAGWTNFGSISNSTSSYGYTDVISHGYFVTTSQDYLNSYNDTVSVRFRTAASTLLGTTFTRTFDWAMVSIRWIEEDAPRRSIQFDYVPTNGRLRVGTEMARLAATASGNIGSWRATLTPEANEGFNWSVTTSGSGLNQQLDFDYVKLNNANKMVITLYASSASASLMRWYQICDWATTTAVDNAADQDCSGGWRSLNKMANFAARQAYGDATRRTYTYHIYEGYWNVKVAGDVTTGTANRIASTSLSNFVSSTNGTVRIRAYSTSTVYTTHMFNYASIQMVVDPVYMPQGLSVISGQSQGESAYVNAENPQTLVAGNSGQTGSDNTYVRASGTAGVTTQFYVPFRNVRTYAGANALLVVAETGCSATGINYKLQVYNFNSPGWEDLSANIACGASGTDTTGQYSLGQVDLSKYVSNGEVRIGMLGSANGTQELRIDWIYMVIGTVVADTAACVIDMGTLNLSDCSVTTKVDTSSAVAQWSINSELQSAAMSHDYYAGAGDLDATAEHVDSVLMTLKFAMATGTSPAGWGYAARFRSGGTGKTLQMQLKDDAGTNGAASNGFINVGTTNAATTTYTYQDMITNGYLLTSPEDFDDLAASSTIVRFRTSAATYTGTATVSDYDLVFVTVRWVEDPNATDLSLSVTDNPMVMGAVTPGGAGTEDGFVFTVDSQNATGFTLGLKRQNANSTLALVGNSSITIPEKNEWVAPGVTTTAGNAVAYTGTGLAIRVGEATDVPFYSSDWWGSDLSPIYAGIPTTTQPVAVQSIPGTVNAKVFFRLDVDASQPAGSYEGNVIATAWINP